MLLLTKLISLPCKTIFKVFFSTFILGEVGDHKNHFDSDMDKVVSEWVNANLEKYPLINQIKTNNNNQDNNTTTERCCSLQETDAET